MPWGLGAVLALPFTRSSNPAPSPAALFPPFRSCLLGTSPRPALPPLLLPPFPCSSSLTHFLSPTSASLLCPPRAAQGGLLLCTPIPGAEGNLGSSFELGARSRLEAGGGWKTVRCACDAGVFAGRGSSGLGQPGSCSESLRACRSVNPTASRVPCAPTPALCAVQRRGESQQSWLNIQGTHIWKHRNKCEHAAAAWSSPVSEKNRVKGSCSEPREKVFWAGVKGFRQERWQSRTAGSGTEPGRSDAWRYQYCMCVAPHLLTVWAPRTLTPSHQAKPYQHGEESLSPQGPCPPRAQQARLWTTQGHGPC